MRRVRARAAQPRADGRRRARGEPWTTWPPSTTRSPARSSSCRSRPIGRRPSTSAIKPGVDGRRRAGLPAVRRHVPRDPATPPRAAPTDDPARRRRDRARARPHQRSHPAGRRGARCRLPKPRRRRDRRDLVGARPAGATYRIEPFAEGRRSSPRSISGAAGRPSSRRAGYPACSPSTASPRSRCASARCRGPRR